MPRLIVSCLGILICLTVGCADEQHATDSSQLPDGNAAHSVVVTPDGVNGASTGDAQLYDGLTLGQWRARIKILDPADPDSGRAVKGLLAIVNDAGAPWFSRRQAAMTLGRIGGPAARAVPVLIELLQQTRLPDNSRHSQQSAPGNDDESPRSWALKALALFGPVAKPATGALISILNAPEQPILDRLASIEALGRIGAAQPEVIPTLLDAFSLSGSLKEGVTDDEAERLRVAAAAALGWIGPSAAPAVPALIRSTAGDQPESLRRAAVSALGQMQAAGVIAMPTLAELIVLDPSSAVRDQAAAALASIGPPSVPLLQRLLQDRDWEVRWRAAESLGKIGPTAAAASQSALRDVLNDKSAEVRLAALQGLWKIDGDAQTVVPALVQELTSADRQIRIRAFRQLIAMGPAARVGTSELTNLLKDERDYVRKSAAMVLEKLNDAD